jgi:predicted RNA methylase
MIQKELDQFFTTEKTAKECLGVLQLHLDIKNVSWIEPSAGAGMFIKTAKEFGFSKCSAAYDLMPQYEEVETQDFLKTDLSVVFKESTTKLCLGNPPFGKKGSLAVKFFNHAAKSCDVIAMIFPATFAKESVKKQLHKSFHLVEEVYLGVTPFDFVSEKRMVTVVFQIWKKLEIDRVDKKEKLKSEYFDFVTKEEADFAIQRVGMAAGKVKVDFERFAKASHYFIKTKAQNVREVFEKIDWTNIKNKTAGNPSIAKTELIAEFEKKMKS